MLPCARAIVRRINELLEQPLDAAKAEASAALDEFTDINEEIPAADAPIVAAAGAEPAAAEEK